jgi:hypothetical protein
LKRRKQVKNWCPPIAFEGAPPCTVEFAETAGGNLYEWRTKYDDGRVFTGICGEEGIPTLIETDPGFDTAAARLEDSRAVKATWPVWDKILDERYKEAYDGVGLLEPIFPFRPGGYKPFTGVQETLGSLESSEEEPPTANRERERSDLP